MSDAECEHFKTIAALKHPRLRQCDECVKIGSEWVT